jgi:uncharacterized protein YifN (PemK superfamily)
MGIKYALGPGVTVRFDYSRGGFQPPEMVKARPVIVISPRLPHRDGLCTVIPLSGDPNNHPSKWDIRLEFDPPLPYPFIYSVAWANATCWLQLDLIDWICSIRNEISMANESTFTPRFPTVTWPEYAQESYSHWD